MTTQGEAESLQGPPEGSGSGCLKIPPHPRGPGEVGLPGDSPVQPGVRTSRGID